MTFRFGPGAQDDAEQHAGECDPCGDSGQAVSCAGRAWAVRCALVSSGAVLCAAGVLTLGQGRTEAVPNVMPAMAALNSDTSVAPRSLRLAQAEADLFEVSPLSAPSGAEIPVRISIPNERVDLVQILFVRGLPEGFALSNAVRLEDAWAVSPQQIRDFSLIPPRDYEGRFELQFVLVWGPERTRDIRMVPVSIGADAAAEGERVEPGTTQSSAEAASLSAAPSSAVTNSAPQISPEEEEEMLERALGILQNGDIAAARLLFQRLADKGSARGALAMAKTYDPEVLSGMSVFGLVPDPKKAAEWYARAAEMGNEQAQERLATLNAGAAR